MEHVESHTTRLLRTVSASEMRSSAVHFFPGDVLYGRLRPYLNKVHRANFEGLCSAEFIVFPAVPHLNPDYLKFFLNSDGFVAFASHLNEGDRPRVDFEQIGRFRFPLPPLDEQMRIAAAIEVQASRIEAAAASLSESRRTLTAYRAAVLKAACEGRLVPTEAELARAEGRVCETGAQLLAAIETERLRRQSEVGKLARAESVLVSLPKTPEGWAWASFDSILWKLRNGIPAKPSEDGGLRILRISAVRPGKVNLSDVRFLPADFAGAVEYHLDDGDLLFTRYNGNPALVGVCGVVKGISLPTVHPDKLIRGKLISSRVSPGWLEIAANTGFTRSVLASRVRTTAGQAGISGSDLKSLPIPIPPTNEQHRIVAEVERRLSVVEQLEAAIERSLHRAARLRQAILKQAFEGKLVPQDPKDEPASVLLERIRKERERRLVDEGTRPRKKRSKMEDAM